MPPDVRLAGPVLDSADPLGLAEFYHRFTRWPIVRTEGPRSGNPPTDGWALLRSPSGDQKIEIQWDPHHVAPTWPSVSGKPTMMVHLDFGVDDVDEGVAWALDCGAQLATHQPQDEVVVLIDPAGHPFCIFQDGP